MSARLRKGDLVIVISGKDKGKTGKIRQIMADDAKVVVEGINLVQRHTRPNPRNQAGGIVEKEAPLAWSKVMPVDPKTQKGTRVRMGTEGGKKVRIAVKSGEALVAKAT